MLTQDFIQAKTNIEILLRERGKIVDRRETHNIFVDIGRAWIAQLIAGEVATSIHYVGFGIGGTRQSNPMVDEAPLTVYPTVGAHSQTDTDVSVLALERPVRITSGQTALTPGEDIWLKASAAPSHPTPTRTRFTCILTELEVSFGAFSAVPLSEIGLFTSEKDPLIRTNQLVAYDTFVPITKTSALQLEVRWNVIF